jgi:hypothetical protein
MFRADKTLLPQYRHSRARFLVLRLPQRDYENNSF